MPETLPHIARFLSDLGISLRGTLDCEKHGDGFTWTLDRPHRSRRALTSSTRGASAAVIDRALRAYFGALEEASGMVFRNSILEFAEDWLSPDDSNLPEIPDIATPFTALVRACDALQMPAPQSVLMSCMGVPALRAGHDDPARAPLTGNFIALSDRMTILSLDDLVRRCAVPVAPFQALLDRWTRAIQLRLLCSTPVKFVFSLLIDAPSGHEQIAAHLELERISAELEDAALRRALQGRDHATWIPELHRRPRARRADPSLL